MRILTQNILMCNVKSCVKKEIALQLIVDKSEIIETEFNPELVKKTLSRLNWNNFVETSNSLGEKDLPNELQEDLLNNNDFLVKMHNMLFQFHVVEGTLMCGECKRVYPIKNGIPNLLLDDSEI